VVGRWTGAAFINNYCDQLKFAKLNVRLNIFSANNIEKSIVAKSHNLITQGIIWLGVELKKKLLIINTINVLL